MLPFFRRKTRGKRRSARTDFRNCSAPKHSYGIVRQGRRKRINVNLSGRQSSAAYNLCNIPIVLCCPIPLYRNKDTAQYTSKSAMTVFVIFAYLENSNLNTAPKSDQHTVKTKPIKASNSAKKTSVLHCP